MKSLKFKPLEKDIQRSILEYLELKNVFHYRQNTGSFVRQESKSFYRFGTPGAPDIVAILPPNGMYLALEVKRDRNKLSPAQIAFKEKLIAVGGLYEVVFSVDDVIRVLDTYYEKH